MAAALEFTRATGYDAVQVFPGNPKGWRHVPLAPATAEQIRAVAAQLDVAPIVIHAPYIINIAAAEPALAANSARSLENSLHRAGEIGARYVIVHAGSHKGAGEEAGIKQLTGLIEAVLVAAPPGTELLIENSAGAGNVLAGSPAALGRLLNALPPQVGACVDTAHLWGGGSDIATGDGVERVLQELDDAVGLERIRVLHVNDSAVPLGSLRDVHANFGEGHIGLPGLAAWLANPALQDHLVILETPLEDEAEREAARCAITRLLMVGDAAGAAAALERLAPASEESSVTSD